jgi:hypothetical protein
MDTLVIACGPRISSAGLNVIVLGLPAFAVLFSALFFLLQRRLVNAMFNLERDSSWAILLVQILLVGVGLSAVGYGTLMASIMLGVVIGDKMPVLGFCIVGGSLVGGILLWRYAIRTRQTVAKRRGPLQFWFQDLLIAAICFAVGLLMLNLELDRPQDMMVFAPWAAGLLCVGTLGLYIGVDVATDSRWAHQSIPRGIFFIVIFTAMPLFFIPTVIGWRIWKRRRIPPIT